MDGCRIGSRNGDPENPPCARLVLSGPWVQLATGTDEQVAALAALFAKHPSFPSEPHDFFVGKIDVDSIWILDKYGGVPKVSPSAYFGATAARTLRQTQQQDLQQAARTTRSRPNPIQKISTARWMVETLTWGALSTVSARSTGSVLNDPFANPYSFSDAGDGRLYFYASSMDASIVDLQTNTRASFSLSEAALTGTSNTVTACVVNASKYGDPENPPCARLVFAGNWTVLDTSRHAKTDDGKVAKAALIQRHPSFAHYPPTHDFFVAELVIDGIWFIDQYGGASHLSPSKYLQFTPPSNTVVV